MSMDVGEFMRLVDKKAAMLSRQPALKGSRINVFTVWKSKGQYYAFFYNEAGREETLLALKRFASNLELNFSWYDQAVLAGEIARVAQVEQARKLVSNRFSTILEDHD